MRQPDRVAWGLLRCSRPKTTEMIPSAHQLPSLVSMSRWRNPRNIISSLNPPRTPNTRPTAMPSDQPTPVMR